MKLVAFYVIVGTLFVAKTTTAQGITFDCGFDPTGSSTAPSTSGFCNYSDLALITNHSDDMVPVGITGTLKLRTNLIFVQDANGEGSFSASNSAHMEFWSDVFDAMNERVSNLQTSSCADYIQ